MLATSILVLPSGDNTYNKINEEIKETPEKCDDFDNLYTDTMMKVNANLTKIKQATTQVSGNTSSEDTQSAVVTGEESNGPVARLLFGGSKKEFLDEYIKYVEIYAPTISEEEFKNLAGKIYCFEGEIDKILK